MENIRQFRINRKFIVVVVLAAAGFMVIGGVLGLWSIREMREMVVNQFNDEQLVIARNVSALIERELGLLRKEALLLNRDLAGRAFAPETFYDLVQRSLSRVLESGVWKIEIADFSSGVTHHFVPQRHWYVHELPESVRGDDFLKWVSDADASGAYFTPPQIKPSGTSLSICTFLAPDRSRAILFNVNISWFLTPFLKSIRSGKSGYAWLIDQREVFLYHPDTQFVGRKAMEVREEKYPEIPLGIISFIQRERMLAGEEGVGWFYSGWHRGITGKIRKLIAYAPIHISDNPPERWAVAVVAPMSEIDDAIRKGSQRLFLLQGLVIVVVALAGGALLFFEIRWAKLLENRVSERTEDLKRSEEKYRSLVESAEDFIFTVDAEGKFQSMNSFTASFFGSRPEEFLGKGLAVLFPDKVAEKQLKLVALVYKFGKSVRDEFEMDMGEHQLWISSNFMPLKNADGNVASVLCIARDVTENKNLERQLINTEKLASLGTLAAGVAHEINNPLGVILGFSDLLLRKTEEDTQEYEDLKTIERQGLLCRDVVQNLLSFARVSEGETEYSDLNRCLGDIIRVVKHTLEMNQIELGLSMADDLPLVAGDSRQLQQVFLNLINNAVAAMERGGALILRSYFEKGTRRAVVQVQDSGIGIRKEDMDHIFEPFFTTKPEGEGTGLGLFVSYGIITKYGGSIDCVSHTADSPGKARGTIFTIKLLTKLSI
jgi:two-component system, NtrC family, sensor kinase